MSFTLDNNPLFNSEERSQDQTKKPKGRPKNPKLVTGNSLQEGLTEEYTRATFILEVEVLEKLKNYAYTKRIGIKDAINKLLKEALNKEEEKLNKKGLKILDRNGSEDL